MTASWGQIRFFLMRLFLIILQNIVFWPLFILVSATYILVFGIFIAALAGFRPRHVVLRWLRRSIGWYGHLIIACAWPFIRVGYRDLAPGEGVRASIYVCNHRSAIDAFMPAFPAIEDGVQIAKPWPFRLPVLGWLASLAGYLSVDPAGFDEFYRQAGRLLDQGLCLVSFPEGTRSVDGSTGPFSSAIFRLAKQKRVPVIPLALAGTERIMPKGSIVLRPGRIQVVKLPALDWSGYRELSVFKFKTKVRKSLVGQLEQLDGQ